MNLTPKNLKKRIRIQFPGTEQLDLTTKIMTTTYCNTKNKIIIYEGLPAMFVGP